MFIAAYAKERRSDAPSPSGSEIETTYGYEVDKKGMKVLKPNGTKNVYEKIQEYLEETKIENVIQRVIAGDTSVLRPDAIYQDITNMPTNMIDAMNQVKALEKTYNELPKEIKDKYQTIEEFVQASGTEKWMKDMGYITEPIPVQTPIVETREEAIPNES